MQYLINCLHLSQKKRLLCYVHNLSFEFQFIRKYFTWNSVFSTDLRKPLSAVVDGGVEFRCSYMLSGFSLQEVASRLLKYKCKKLAGNLDYNLIRHSCTILTNEELQYCKNDCLIVMNYIQELIEREGNICKIPLTKTGFVRKVCRRGCLRLNGKPNYSYIDMIANLYINNVKEFDFLQAAFCGGSTHSSENHKNEILTDVNSYDITSSYPYTMVSEQFPMGRGRLVRVKDMEHFNKLIHLFHCVFVLEINNLEARRLQDFPINVNKCLVTEDVVLDSGRVVCAKKIVLITTNIDYEVFKLFYKWESVRIGTMYCYKKQYLPSELVKSILTLYGNKTKFKGVKEKEVEYQKSKELLNSIYGMSVTSPLYKQTIYENGTWEEREYTEEEKEDLLNDYNFNRNRFLFYAWGVFVTAFARRNLFLTIASLKEDYVYSDTDCVKILHGEVHGIFFKNYNKMVYDKLCAACTFHNIPIELCLPKTANGAVKMLGGWEYEGTYKRFKTLGAKRYMQEDMQGNISLCVSGVDKKNAVPFLLQQYGTEGIFNAFNSYLYLPEFVTGKHLNCYIDYVQSGAVKDYMGNIGTFETLSGLHMESIGFKLNMSFQYLDSLQGITPEVKR